jgi:hypothetical protein
MADRARRLLSPHAGTTLAVLSCALALLAARPVDARGPRAETPAAMLSSEPRVATESAFRISALPVAADRPWSRQRPVRALPRGVAAPHHASLLVAALDQLSRLVTRELSPVIHADLAPGLSALRVVSAPTAVAPRVPRRGAATLPLSAEQAWAIARQLLAPPDA